MGRTALWLFCAAICMVISAQANAQKLASICKNVHCPESFTVSNNPAICPRANEVRAGLLYDINRNEIVFHKNLSNAYPIASVTKMMVALITAEQVESGKLSWTDEVKFRMRVRKSRRSRTYVTRWYSYTLKDLTKSTLIASNNTSARELAKFVGGTQDTFIAMMNKRAKELGMTSTQYSNPSGLPEKRSSDDNMASPEDLLKLTLHFMQHEELMEITGMHYSDIKVNGRTSRLVNTNKLVSEHQIEFLGLKTGYINRARHCLVAAANVDSTVVVAVVLGVQGSATRNAIIQEMMNNYYYEIGNCRLGEHDRNAAFVRAVSNGQIKLSEEERNDYKTVYKGAKTVYKVRRGDNLSMIAQRHGCSVSQLKRWNRLRSTRIYAGQRLYVNTLVKSLEFNPGWQEGESIASNTKSASPVAAIAPVKSTPPVGKSSSVISPKSTIKHRVESGETLSHLATIYGCSVRQIMNWNDLNSTKIRMGQQLIVSAGSKNTVTEKEQTHIVRSGENLTSISKKYGVSVAELKDKNNLSSSIIKVGQKLSIVRTFAGEVPVSKKFHTVRSGETLSQLAETYKCSIDQIKSWNNISGSRINVGQRLTIYNPGVLASTKIGANSQKQYLIYEVRSGDTLWDISKKFDGSSVNDIKKLNNIRNGRSLKPGMKLKIEQTS
ncbi:MAG: LysM peptidoglycan-binding domain-containing protein [Bacteroidia bacterium]|nr:LysM peptidoglycan-binding domain-containing protein [Bacteroidia bacterium]